MRVIYPRKFHNSINVRKSIKSLTPSERKFPPTISPELTLRDIIKTLPSQVFVKDMRKAWLRVIVSVSGAVVGYWALAVSPWWLLPPLWLLTGINLLGLWIIGHDCGHRSFAKRNWVNNLVGHLLFLPLMYPFHSWRISHDHHHKHTNKLDVDDLWNPLTTEQYDTLPVWLKWGYRRVRRSFWWTGSIGYWLIEHFNWLKFENKQRKQVKFSVIFVLVAGAICFPTLLLTVGVWGFVKLWLVPWLLYHFWFSTLSLVQHTMPEIPFKSSTEWNEVEANLCGSVHCKYPRWMEFLWHDANMHVPHHISTGIPVYNLRQAHESLRENWSEYLYECQFSWQLMGKIVSQCHLYDAQINYISFTQYHQTQTNDWVNN